MKYSLSAGIARQIITPSPGTPLFGYPTERLGDHVADDLNATALVLQSGTTTAVLVSLDIAVIDEEETTKIREEASAQTGIAPENITLHATHTHSGPATISLAGWGGRNIEYLDSVRPRIVQAIVEAQQSLQPVRVGFGVTKTNVGINRRELTLEGGVMLGFHEWGPRDDDLTVVRFEGENGTVAQIIHLSA
ncbi:MAG: neutral/alkaline non-lysosomal ceramidase N-terminal domain-containing protein, partial [Abditibacteriaceae bacterium]